MAEAITVNIVTFGEPETGIWCDDCMLPSMIRIRLVGQSGMSVLDFGKHDYCDECDTYEQYVGRVIETLPKYQWVRTRPGELPRREWTEVPYENE